MGRIIWSFDDLTGVFYIVNLRTKYIKSNWYLQSTLSNFSTLPTVQVILEVSHPRLPFFGRVLSDRHYLIGIKKKSCSKACSTCSTYTACSIGKHSILAYSTFRFIISQPFCSVQSTCLAVFNYGTHSSCASYFNLLLFVIVVSACKWLT